MDKDFMRTKQEETIQGRQQDVFQKNGVIFLLAFVSNFLWGSAFPCIKIGYGLCGIQAGATNNQILYAGLRFILSGLMVILTMSVVRRRFLLPKRVATWKHIATLSIFQTILQYMLFYIGIARTSGVKSSIIEASNVFIALLVSAVIFRQEKLEANKLLGSAIGFMGIILINLQGLELQFNIGDGCVFLSTFAYAMSSVLLKRYAKEEDTVVLSGWQFFFGGIVMTIIGLCMGGEIPYFDGKGLAMLLYLGFISAMAYSLWALLLAHNPVSKIAVLGFMNPMCGVILSAILLQEGQQAFGVKGLIALILVCTGIFVVYRT